METEGGRKRKIGPPSRRSSVTKRFNRKAGSLDGFVERIKSPSVGSKARGLVSD
jgi:hypothetical protein